MCKTKEEKTHLLHFTLNVPFLKDTDFVQTSVTSVIVASRLFKNESETNFFTYKSTQQMQQRCKIRLCSREPVYMFIVYLA